MESHLKDSSERSGYFTGKVASTLLHLSADLKSVFEKQINCDLALCVGDRTIMCHKAILRARSKWFASEIELSDLTGTSSIIVDENEEILDALLVFMYTGNLRLVESLNVPLLDLCLAAVKYRIDRLSKLINKMIMTEEIPWLKGSIPFKFKVNINNCIDDFYTSIVEGGSLDGTDRWNLKIQSRDICDTTKRTLYVYVSRETIKGNKKFIHVANLGLHIVDSTGKRLRSFSGHHIFRADDHMKMAQDISLCKVGENADELHNGSLSFTGHLTVVGEELTPSQRVLFQIKNHHQKRGAKELQGLSYDMLKLLKEAKYTDIGIFISGSSSFKVNLHSYILFARSSIPIHLIGDIIEHGCSGSIVWRSFIHYLYTGQPRYLEDHMHQVYMSVCKLQLYETKGKYFRILASRRMKLDPLYVILEAANKYGDAELKRTAVSFIKRSDCLKATCHEKNEKNLKT